MGAYGPDDSHGPVDSNSPGDSNGPGDFMVLDLCDAYGLDDSHVPEDSKSPGNVMARVTPMALVILMVLAGGDFYFIAGTELM